MKSLGIRGNRLYSVLGVAVLLASLGVVFAKASDVTDQACGGGQPARLDPSVQSATTSRFLRVEGDFVRRDSRCLVIKMTIVGKLSESGFLITRETRFLEEPAVGQRIVVFVKMGQDGKWTAGRVAPLSKLKFPDAIDPDKSGGVRSGATRG